MVDMAPSSSQVNVYSPMEKCFNLFICGLCTHVVAPYPKECADCNSLFCTDCVAMRARWMCPTCKSVKAARDCHHSVKEIIDNLYFYCPGCKV